MPTFECPHEDCNKSYTREDSLKRHFLSIHNKDDTLFECDECDHVYKSKQSLNVHKKRKHENTKIPCIDEKCDMIFSDTRSMKIHFEGSHSNEFKCKYCIHSFKKNHILNQHLFNNHPEYIYRYDEVDNIFHCIHEHCDFFDTSVEKIRQHYIRKHFNKVFKCPDKNCEKEFSMRYLLNNHIKTHLPRTFECEECDSKFKTKDGLKSHFVKVHEEKIYFCEVEGCGSSGFSKLCLLKEHMKFHNTNYEDYPNMCSTCGYRTYCSTHLKRHELIHANKREFECRYTYCNECFNDSNGRNAHEKTHSNYNITRKKQERNVLSILEKWGYSVDFETTINASRQKCLNDTDKYFYRLDFHIINCVNAILILEVDENQHKDVSYPLSCELSRMSDVRVSLLKAGYKIPIYWIRYSPNSNYIIGDIIMRNYTQRYKRENALKEYIDYLCSPDFVPNKQVNIHYMFYDLKSKEEGPKILDNPDFNEALKECTTWHV